MKCTIPEISWHNRDPVLSVDIQPKNSKTDLEEIGFYRLASGGTDSHVLIWYMRHADCGQVSLELAADLTRHQRAVNVVRWSPSAELLASGDDESVIFIWKQKEDSEPINIVDATNDQDKEIWIAMKILRGHVEDVYDLSWSPNSLQLISGSVDNTAMLWDVYKGKSLGILRDHKGFVQGVAWDPANQYLATLSTDRYFRVFDVNTKRTISRINKSVLPVPESSKWHGKDVRLYHDDTLQTFFRRLCFSPDGELIITPSGVNESEDSAKPLNTTYIFTRYSLKQPAIILPSPDQYTVAVRCCPLLFHLREHDETNPPVIPLPYRMIFAVATKSCVYLYDTQQRMPFGLISNIHYTRLSDMTWSYDGQILVVSSTDGFCSIITFGENELGTIYDDRKIKEKLAQEWEQNKKKSKTKKTKKVKSDEIMKDKKEDSIAAGSTEAVIIDDDVEMIDVKKPVEIKEITSIPPIIEKLEILNKIIKSDDNFSPEKRSRPVTPIAIRRHPRILDSIPIKAENEVSPATKPIIEPQNSATNTSNKANSSHKLSAKKANSIVIRRQPRALIQPTPLEKACVMEEAIDAWPIDQPKPQIDYPVMVERANETENKQPICVESIMGLTEDIKLFVDDSEVDDFVPKKDTLPGSEMEPAKTDDCPKTPKTPRRVKLITISTPKSNKKSGEHSQEQIDN